jgi:hydrogenase-4 component F
MTSALLGLLLALPAVLGGLCLLLPSARAVLATLVIGTLGELVLCILVAVPVFAGRTRVFAAGQWLFVDALSAYHLVVMAGVFALAAVYARGYFDPELDQGKTDRRAMRQFGALGFASLSAMALVLVSNHLALMWIGIEATTLLTAFLICFHVTPTSLEAMWKYLLVCSVGVAFAFLGTLLVEVSTLRTGGGDLLWTRLRSEQASLDPVSLKAAFVFLLVGYGTKAGIAPMHGWLPDAHSQAPAPASAIFSGFMLNAALYSLMRAIPLVDGATGSTAFSSSLLTGFGLLSMFVAGAFILVQKDIKRLLAYSSVEHVGIMTVGLGLGGLGTFAALLHTLNHSLGKPVAFFSAGKLGQERGTHQIAALSGALHRVPLWGAALFTSLLALIGMAPFGIFMSELLVVRASLESHATITMGLFLAALAVVFVGALRHTVALAWSDAPKAAGTAIPVSVADRIVVFVPLALLIVLGLWLPSSLHTVLDLAADVVRGRP